MDIRVHYPSGKTFTISGRWRGPQRLLAEPNVFGTEADGVVVEAEDGQVVVLDPRGTYSDAATGQVLYRGFQA
jgi:hypothetical protein